MLNYTDKSYAHGRLVGTIVRLKGKPVLVQELFGDEITVKNLITGKTEEGLYYDLDINPVPLGYSNFKGVAYYISRCPMRKDWKQGLRAQTMRALPCGYPVPVTHEISLKEVAKTIVGDFPSLNSVIKNVKDATVSSMAFSRTFALDNSFNIWHKAERNIGSFNLKKEKAEIADEFFWVKEELEECMG